MCGLVGLIDARAGTPDEALCTLAHDMAATLTHRGPDDAGQWSDAAAGVALGFRRLAILDLSPSGHQPMVSASGRFVIVFNGEVYNHDDLRRELEAMGATFRGRSDTEVILAAFEAWGVVAAVPRFVGMFAIACWDRHERRLHLVRDRMGVKPLYYGRFGHTLLFGSELKALRVHPDFVARIDRDALALYFRHLAVPSPYTIYQGVRKLPPGTILTVQPGDLDLAQPCEYWSVRDVIAHVAPFGGHFDEACDALDVLLRDAVQRRMVADVPLGAFLSGGIDSSLVVALMQACSDRPIDTFTIGYRETLFDEAGHAREVARHLGTRHTEWMVTPEDAREVIPRLADLYDEPFSDVSQIPTFLVSSLARQHVTVVLSGDGGDEIFGGYNRHFWAPAVWQRIRRWPRFLRSAAASAMTALSPGAYNRVFSTLSPLLPARLREPNPGYKLGKLAAVMCARDPDAFYRGLASHWKDPGSLVIEAKEPPTILTDPTRHPALADFTLRMMYFDQVTYLPDDNLTKVDRASMGAGLEVRVPLLDHRVVEFMWGLPVSMKVAEGRGKVLLRHLLYRHVPPALVDRPKMGFDVPIGCWLRGPLRDWASTLLAPQRLMDEGILDPRPVQKLWQQHQAGRFDHGYLLWDVLMFQAWRQRWAP